VNKKQPAGKTASVKKNLTVETENLVGEETKEEQKEEKEQLQEEPQVADNTDMDFYK